MNNPAEKSKRVKMRQWLEFKDGSFRDVREVLVQPDWWDDLTAESRRLVRRYAAATIKIRLR